MKNLFMFILIWGLAACQSNDLTQANQSIQNESLTTVTFASFNVSMEASNYVKGKELAKGSRVLMELLAQGEHPQIHNIAEIIQRTRPDVILLNEFDYIDNPQLGINAFTKNYLNKAHGDAKPIDYQYIYVAPSNTGLPTTFDLNNDGKIARFGNDAYGYGRYYGQYGMALLSRYPIDYKNVRTFAKFLWADMPGAIKPIHPETKKAFYDEQEWLSLRLSSKSHWDVPIDVNGKTIHVLASHPTPPVFDGVEDHNGARNHDEVRFWHDYIRPKASGYIYDDRGLEGGIKDNSHFVIMGDLNAAAIGGNARKEAITGLLTSPLVNQSSIPSSEGGRQNKPDIERSQQHTAGWGMRIDYVIPSSGIEILKDGVFWPTKDSELFRLVKDRKSSSDHRLVWVELAL